MYLEKESQVYRGRENIPKLLFLGKYSKWVNPSKHPSPQSHHSDTSSQSVCFIQCSPLYIQRLSISLKQHPWLPTHKPSKRGSWHPSYFGSIMGYKGRWWDKQADSNNDPTLNRQSSVTVPECLQVRTKGGLRLFSGHRKICGFWLGMRGSY